MGSSFETATAISVGSLTDSVGFGNDDYFKFNLQNQGNIALSLNRLSGSANLELYNAFQTKINESTNPDGTTELISTALNAGTYYIKVSGQSDYSLNLQSQQSQQQNNLFWRDTTSGNNSIWSMNGMTIASTTTLTSMAPEWTMDGIADFNKDGQQDFVWRLPATGESLIWYMNGTAIASTESLPTLADPWIIAGVADMNKDENPDLLWRNPTTGENLIWYLNGTTVASTATLNSVPYAGWVVSGIGDMNGDGQQDIVWRNDTTGQNRIWHMNGATRIDNVAMRGVAAGWLMTGVMDYDRDGKLDIIWHQPETGRNNLWAMNDTELISATALPTLRGTWTTKPFQQIITPALDIDSAGNSSAQAFNIGTLTAPVIYKEWASSSDPDWYEFKLNDRSEVRAIATGATVQIVNAQGAEENGILKVGTYYARVTGGGAYTLSIIPLPIITVSDFTNATEPSTAGSFTISRSGSLDQALTVKYAISGTATSGNDYQTLGQSVVIPAGQASITLPVTVNDDAAVEEDETVTLTLTPEQSYTIDKIASRTITIADDDLDAGNTLETAKDIGVLVDPQAFSDRVDKTDKQDYYKFQLLSPGTLKATMTVDTADIDIELLDATGHLLDFSDNSGIQDESISRFLPADIYYLFVYPYGNAQSNYTLNVWRV